MNARETARYEKMVLALGYVCIRWAWIERAIGDFIAELANLTQDEGRTLTNNADIRQKIQMLKGLAFLKKPSQGWFNYLQSTLDYLDNDIRPRRNSYVHGEWLRPSGKHVVLNYKTKFKKPQAFQGLMMDTHQIAPLKLRDLTLLESQMVHTLLDIVALFSYAMKRGADEALPDISFEQFLRMATLSKHPKRARKTRKSPPRSSRG